MHFSCRATLIAASNLAAKLGTDSTRQNVLVLNLIKDNGSENIT
jgi:hypothetical protein